MCFGVVVAQIADGKFGSAGQDQPQGRAWSLAFIPNRYTVLPGVGSWQDSEVPESSSECWRLKAIYEVLNIILKELDKG